MKLIKRAVVLFALAVFAIAAAACLWGALTYWNIPFCLECNGGVTPEDLGWMAPWFYPQ